MRVSDRGGASARGGALRVVGGALRGRRFGHPAPVTRPTSDRVREAIGSILEARGGVEGARVLELFAGTGALSFEALSRGAREAWLVERDARACHDIDASRRALGLEERSRLLRIELSAQTPLERFGEAPFELVLADPPYALAEDALALLARIASAGLLAQGGLALLEHASRDRLDLEAAPARAIADPLRVVARYRYGESTVSLLRASSEPTHGERRL